MQLLDNNEKETFMGSFPQVDKAIGVRSERNKGGLNLGVSSFICLW